MPNNEEEFKKAIDKYLDQIADRIFFLSQDRLLRDGKVDTGTLFKTANVNREFLKKQIIYPASYAEYVEFGRNPGSMPPSDALHKWVSRKLRIKDPKEIKSVSFAIAKSIEQRGILPSPFIRPAIEKTKIEFGV